MLNRMFPFIVPLLAFLTAITGIVAIGEALIFTYDIFHGNAGWGPLIPPLVAMVMVALIGIGGALLSARAAKLPPAPWPDPGPMEPVRRLDLGAGYLVGQFVFFFGLGLLLLFAILALR